jgi:hypothetical protein
LTVTAPSVDGKLPPGKSLDSVVPRTVIVSGG